MGQLGDGDRQTNKQTRRQTDGCTTPSRKAIALLRRELNVIVFNPLEFRGNYSAISNNMKLVQWPLMGGLLHLVERGGA